LQSPIFETLEFDKILSALTSLTISPLGNEHIRELTPFMNSALLQHKLAEVTEMRAVFDFDDPFPIYGLKDIRIALKKAEIKGNFLQIEELTNISLTLTVFRRLHDYFKSRTSNYPWLVKIASDINAFDKIEREIFRCINPETHEIYDRASPNLSRIRKSIIATQQTIRKRMEGLASSLSRKNYLQDNVITLREHRLVLMVKDEHRQQVKGIVHDQSATGATLFVEPLETIELNNQIRSLLLEEKREIEQILLILTNLVYQDIEEIQRSLNAAGYLDFIYAKAQLSKKMDGNSPTLNNENYIEIIKGKHPLLILREGKKKEVVAIDLVIGKDFKTLVVTGPNAGGKTVALKTIGLLSLMMSCGLHVPIDPCSSMCLFHNIFGVIGDQQSIESDLSTFSSHVEKLNFILKNVTANDLVLIDEICSGTDPEEGATLAIAIMEELTRMGCSTIVCTHLGALKAFAHETAGVENGSMEFNSETLQPTYRFRLGLPGSSYAFEIAQRWGISEQIIHRSRELLGTEKHHLENLLIELEKKMTNYQFQLNEISIKQSELDGLKKLYQGKRNQLAENEKQLKEKAIQEAKEIVAQANIAVEQAIKKIKEEQASRIAIKEAKELVETIKENLTEQTAKIKPEVSNSEQVLQVGQFKIGDYVLWKTYHKTGIIQSEADAANRVLIDTGEVKIKVPIEELVISKKVRELPKIQVNISNTPEAKASSELNLLGMRSEEAVDTTDKFIQAAVVTGLKEVYIIHGKGTGALRNSINQFLDSHPYVKSKHLADWNRGGTGVTIVELK
jgi:DNA mismatch repair protein MutS2